MIAEADDARLELTDTPDGEAEAVIRDGLGAYNFEKAGYRDHRRLAILVPIPGPARSSAGCSAEHRSAFSVSTPFSCPSVCASRDSAAA